MSAQASEEMSSLAALRAKRCLTSLVRVGKWSLKGLQKPFEFRPRWTLQRRRGFFMSADNSSLAKRHVILLWVPISIS